jgi:hypothetical protein
MIQAKELIQAYAHCHNPLCVGYGQESVDAVKITTSKTGADFGADGPAARLVETSWDEIVLPLEAEQSPQADPARTCGHCGQPREVTTQERPSYDPLSGFDPMGLVNSQAAGGFNPSVVNTEQDAQIAAMQAQIAKLTALVGGKE